MFELRFPGYGLGWRNLNVESVEIPQRDKERCVVARESGVRLIVLDDLIYGTASNAVRHVKLEGNKLRYFDNKGSLVREKQL